LLGGGVSEALNPILDHYRSLEAAFDVRTNPDYGGLVVPNGNSREPLHRWFHLKEAFSCELVPRVLKDLSVLGDPDLRVLDPFSGVGTTAASLVQLAATGELVRPTVYGLEANPFLHLVASAKLRSHTEDVPAMLPLGRTVAAAALADTRTYAAPPLSTFHDPRFFDVSKLQVLLRLREAIDRRVPEPGPSLSRDLLRVALASTIETVANLRRDGRALRFTPKNVNRHPVDDFLARCELIDDDLPRRRINIRGAVHHGDGVSMDAIDRRYAPFDLVIFSPPYPNNIDYTEVYKLENWFLGLISDSSEFRERRLATVHSHPSVSRPDRLPDRSLSDSENRALAELVAPLVDNLPDDRYRRGRKEVLEGYVVDMYRTLSAACGRLKPGAHLVYVVGNSAHGRGDSQFVIAADLLMAACARLAGLEVLRLEVARHLRRRACPSPYLRESVVFARRPPSTSPRESKR
jgi:hypothetical protein